MRKTMILIAGLALLAAAAVAVPVVLAQGPRWAGSGGWGDSSQLGRMYNPSTVETVKGEIAAVSVVAPLRGMSNGVQLTLRTQYGEMPVHVGPAWYIENQDIKLEPRDQIEVTGSRVDINGKPALIASQITKGENVLTLRDRSGIPMWAGWHRRATTGAGGAAAAPSGVGGHR